MIELPKDRLMSDWFPANSVVTNYKCGSRLTVIK